MVSKPTSPAWSPPTPNTAICFHSGCILLTSSYFSQSLVFEDSSKMLFLHQAFPTPIYKVPHSRVLPAVCVNSKNLSCSDLQQRGYLFSVFSKRNCFRVSLCWTCLPLVHKVEPRLVHIINVIKYSLDTKEVPDTELGIQQ